MLQLLLLPLLLLLLHTWHAAAVVRLQGSSRGFNSGIPAAALSFVVVAAAAAVVVVAAAAVFMFVCLFVRILLY